MLNSCSIIIRCYNEEKHIGKLLHGIMQQTVKDIEIIVVDSGSTDRTLEVASRFPTKIVSIQPEYFSFGRSLNLGCLYAKQEFIVIASAHVYPLYKDWLEQLLAPFKDQHVAMVYGKQRGGEVTQFSEHQVFKKWYPDKSNSSQPHPFCNNANAAIRKKIWERFPYDEDLTGLEDLGWAKQAIQSGYKIAYQAGAVVTHIHEELPRQIFNRYRREAVALKHIFPNEVFRFGDFLRLFMTNVLMDYRYALRSKQLLNDWLDILRFRLMQFWGTYRGFRESGSVTEQLKRKFYYPNSTPRTTPSAVTFERHQLLIDYHSKGQTYCEYN